MWIRYNPDTDILTIRLDAGETEFRNEFFADDTFEVIFDIDGDDRIAGIDILDASKRVNLEAILPVARDRVSTRTG
jgi:uncharacterized protein YuzE